MIVPIVLLAAVFVLIIALISTRTVIVAHIRRLIIPAVCVIFIICLLLMSETAVKAATDGLALWAGVIVPSLFPFFVAADIMNATGLVKAAGALLEPVMRPFFNVPGSASFALVMGAVSGYPVGAKITADMRNARLLTTVEAERLLAFTNNSGPVFVISSIGAAMYGSPKIGIFLFICQVLAFISVGFLFRFYKGAVRTPPDKKGPARPFGESGRRPAVPGSSTRPDFGTMLAKAINNSASSILVIGGFVVIFSVIIRLLTEAGIIDVLANAFTNLLSPFGMEKEIMKGILSGLLEITTGSVVVGRAMSAGYALKLASSNFIIGWAGLCVHFQVISVISKTDIRIGPYLFGKLLQGILAMVYTLTALKLFRFDAFVTEPVLNSGSFSTIGIFPALAIYLCFMFIVLVLFFVLSKVSVSGKGRTNKGEDAEYKKKSFI